MNKADDLLKANIINILTNGSVDENPRPKYKDGTPAHSLYISQVYEKYDLTRGDFPITSLRPIPIVNGIKEIRWIYQDQTSSLEQLRLKYGIVWWDEWDIGDGTIGLRYGGTIKKYDLMNKLLYNLLHDPYSRRHIISMWQEEDFQETKGLPPCAFQTMFTVRNVGGKMYLDMTLTQRSSDYLVAGHINKMQYVAFQMMVAKHCGYEVGNFAHFVQNLHIYDRHIEQAEILLERTPSTQSPILKLNVPDKTDFYSISEKDFELINYEPVKPQLKFELGV
ncbi:thymidylate synthase [Paenibacillus odorifer]|uniref:thymidylate synthase n=1 Tax=Paenibacillus odorifer TaxID=189426 RepID=UPI00096CBDBD|nr:thymidylate synthase [Paenibacillus odorifer]OME54095.1 thymidylate synthase [Paenibacillus odorifer]